MLVPLAALCGVAERADGAAQERHGQGLILHVQSILRIRERDSSRLGTNKTSLERMTLEERRKGFALLDMLGWVGV